VTIIDRPGKVPIVVGGAGSGDHQDVFTPTEPSNQQQAVCTLLPCNFDGLFCAAVVLNSVSDGTCGYTQGSFFGTAAWQRRSGVFGHPLSRHTDIELSRAIEI
jgi:hypothetical protein